MTAHNPAMSFWPLERQLIDGTTPSDQDCREMLLEARRLQMVARTVDPDTQAMLDRIRDSAAASVNAMANLSHAERYVPAYERIADAEYAERRAGE